MVDNLFWHNILTSGALNAANSGYDPAVIPQGLVITHGKYVVVTNKWVTSGSRGSFVMWFFHISGTMGRYIDVRLDVGLKIVN
jgi:hypothetical protein